MNETRSSSSNEIGNKYQSESFGEIIRLIFEKTKSIIKVAEVGIVIDEEDLKVRLLNNPDSILKPEKLESLTLSPGDVVVILFTDTDFRQNLSVVKNGGESNKVISKDLHNISNGIIIGKL